MPKRSVNREGQGRLIAQTSGAISMINESSYNARSKSGLILITSLQPNLNGYVHVQIIRATMPSVSMYMQLNITVVKARLFNPSGQAVR